MGSMAKAGHDNGSKVIAIIPPFFSKLNLLKFFRNRVT